MARRNMADSDSRYKIKNEKSQVNAVREEYKRYKKRMPPPDLSDVIDFEDSETFCGRVKTIYLNNSECPFSWHNCPNSGLSNPSIWNVFEVISCPGFLFIVNPFRRGVQHYFVQRSLKHFPSKPNVTNLDAHVTLEEGQSIWEDRENCDESSPRLIERLRWAHLGYQFDYNNVQYKPELYYGFPRDLANLTCHIANAIGYPDYRPESGVVNYYPLGSSMGGHVDKYENDLSQPLVSVSFGQSAVYLIGGKTSDVRPTALLVKSGDVIVMTGESRLAYHAVPCIIKVGSENEPPECLKWDSCCTKEKTPLSNEQSGNECYSSGNLGCPICPKYYDCEAIIERSHQFAQNEEDWKPFASYLARTRININVRQVHKSQENVQLNLT